MHLFKKNIFSVPSPSFSKSTDSETTRLSSIIQKHYPGLLVKEMYQIGAFELNSNNWKIVTNRGTFILKRSDISKHEALSAQAELAFQLRSVGFPTLQFLKNKNGRLISNDEQYIYCITFFETGNYFGSSIAEWEDLIINQKKLFDYSLKNSASESSAIPQRSFFTPEEDRLVNKLQASAEIKEISRIQIEHVITEYEKSKIIFRANQKKYNSAVFHVDIHPHNLIFNDNKLVLLTDFESFQFTTVQISMGFGLYKCLRQLLTINEQSTISELHSLINKLKMQFEKVFPDKNFKELIILGKIDVLKRLLFILKEMLEKGESKWLFIFETQMDSLEEINEIERLLSFNQNFEIITRHND